MSGTYRLKHVPYCHGVLQVCLSGTQTLAGAGALSECLPSTHKALDFLPGTAWAQVHWCLWLVCNPTLRRCRQEDGKFRVILGFTVSFRAAWGSWAVLQNGWWKWTNGSGVKSTRCSCLDPVGQLITNPDKRNIKKNHTHTLAYTYTRTNICVYMYTHTHIHIHVHAHGTIGRLPITSDPQSLVKLFCIAFHFNNVQWANSCLSLLEEFARLFCSWSCFLTSSVSVLTNNSWFKISCWTQRSVSAPTFSSLPQSIRKPPNPSWFASNYT